MARNDFTALGSSCGCLLVNLRNDWQYGEPTAQFPAELSEFFICLGADLKKRPEFLEGIARQSELGARGVFVLNFESYRDIEVPPPVFQGPVSVLYCVGAGLKPNRLLQTHGYDERTRVVYFDYSARALDFRRLLLTDWDGRRYPDFLRQVLNGTKTSDTHFFLWPGADPKNLDWAEMERLWLAEADRWGGENAIAEHWSRYRELDHEFLQCNILSGQDEMLERMRDENGSVIWWSNAFCTIYSAYHYTLDEKRDFYERWIAKLANKAPRILLYGSDHSNSPVNGISAADYLREYRKQGGDPLGERRLYRYAMRF